MNTQRKIRFFIMLPLLFLIPVFIQAQTDKKEAELKKLETSLTTAKAKVALNEAQLAKSDSLITSGTQMIAEQRPLTLIVRNLTKVMFPIKNPLLNFHLQKIRKMQPKPGLILKPLIYNISRILKPSVCV